MVTPQTHTVEINRGQETSGGGVGQDQEAAGFGQRHKTASSKSPAPILIC